jgi:hypothetical protein
MGLTLLYQFIEGRYYGAATWPHSVIKDRFGDLDWRAAANQFRELNRRFLVAERRGSTLRGHACIQFFLVPDRERDVRLAPDAPGAAKSELTTDLR